MNVAEFLFTFTASDSSLVKALSASEQAASKTTSSIDKNLTRAVEQLSEAAKTAGKQVGQSMNELRNKAASAKTSVDSTTRAVGSLTDKLAKVAIASFALDSLSSFKSGLLESINLVDKLGKDADAIGIDVSSLNALQEAAGRAGGTAEGVTNALSQLSKDAEALAATGKSRLLPTFKALGISMLDSKGKARSSYEILRELAKVFGTMSKQKSLGLGQKIGLDDGTIKLLQMGQVEFDKLVQKQRELGVVSAEDAAQAAALNDELADLGQQTGYVKNKLFALAAQGLNFLFRKLREAVMFLKENRAFTIGFFTSVAAVLTYMYLPAAIRAAAATWATIAPFAAAAAIVAVVAAAIGLAVDEIYNFIQGNETLLGDFLSKYPMIENIVRAVFTGISSAYTSFMRVAQSVYDIVSNQSTTFGQKLTQVFSLVGQGVTAMGRMIWDALDSDGEKMMWLLDRVDDVKSGFSAMGEWIRGILDSIGASWASFIDLITAGATSMKNALSFGGTTPTMPKGLLANQGASGGGSVTTTTTNIGGNTTVNVYGGNPKEVQRAVESAAKNADPRATGRK